MGRRAAIWTLLTLITFAAIAGAARGQRPEICERPPAQGDNRCYPLLQGYYFDPATGRCELRLVRSCRWRRQGAQMFETLDKCRRTCIYYKGSDRRPGEDPTADHGDEPRTEANSL